MSVALSVTVLAGRHWACDQIDVGLKAAGWVPLPARGDRGRGALVPALRPSYRDVEELLAERGIQVDHVTVFRWVQTFTAEFIDTGRPSRHAIGDRWFVDETYVKVSGRCTNLYRAVDQHGQVIDVLLSDRRAARAARTFTAVVLNLLSVGAAFGLLVLVFQHGVGAGLLGFHHAPTIEAWVPLFLFSVLFGLSMDYQVFLLNRIRERYDQTHDTSAAITFGVASTARIITGAALIIVAVFAGSPKAT